jgi:hypothetical protein
MYHSPAGQWMAQHAIDARGVSVALACRAFAISQRCFRYVPLLSDENGEIEDWLIALTKARKNWGFGLCYLYLRNIKGFKWNHKRVRPLPPSRAFSMHCWGSGQAICKANLPKGILCLISCGMGNRSAP